MDHLNHPALVLLGGFGNIATGHIETWDLRGFKKLGACSAPDTTYLQWDPRGETFITATTYPRLTVGNGLDINLFLLLVVHNLTRNRNKFFLDLKSRIFD